jgi:hypothetical protein
MSQTERPNKGKIAKPATTPLPNPQTAQPQAPAPASQGAPSRRELWRTLHAEQTSVVRDAKLGRHLANLEREVTRWTPWVSDFTQAATRADTLLAEAEEYGIWTGTREVQDVLVLRDRSRNAQEALESAGKMLAGRAPIVEEKLRPIFEALHWGGVDTPGATLEQKCTVLENLLTAKVAGLARQRGKLPPPEPPRATAPDPPAPPPEKPWNPFDPARLGFNPGGNPELLPRKE